MHRPAFSHELLRAAALTLLALGAIVIAGCAGPRYADVPCDTGGGRTTCCLGGSGRCGECCAATVDRIADCEPNCEALYNPAFDLTRLRRSDGLHALGD